MAAHAELASVHERERVDASNVVEAFGGAGVDHQREIPTTDSSHAPITIHERNELLRVGLDCGKHVGELGFGDGGRCDVHTPPSTDGLRPVAIRGTIRLRCARSMRWSR